MGAGEGIKYDFLSCGDEPIGLYPIVDNSVWLKKLLPLGVRTIQLRIKNRQVNDLDNEIQQALSLQSNMTAEFLLMIIGNWLFIMGLMGFI